MSCFWLLWQDDPIEQQRLPGTGPRRWTQLRSLCPGCVWWCHYITDCNTSFGLSVVHYRHRVQPVSSTAQPPPGWYYDHHHWGNYRCFGAGLHHHLNDTIQGLQPPRSRPRKSSHCCDCNKTAEQRTRRRGTSPSPSSLCFQNNWVSGRPSTFAVQSHVA